MKNILLIILDGLGDRPNADLSGRTALQAAFRPNMNTLIRDGQGGLMSPIRPGVRAGSDTSHLSLLGYDPEKFYTGRGPFEAMGIGMDVRGGDIAFRVNFGTRGSDGIIVDRRAGRISNGTDRLAKDLNFDIDGVQFFVKEGVEHRAALVMRGDNLSDQITDSDPHDPGKKVADVLALQPEAAFTAKVLNKYLAEARIILDRHEVNKDRKHEGKPPANELLVRGAGQAPTLLEFKEQHGFSGVCISGIPMITGIGKLLGLETIKAKGSTGTLNSDFISKMKLAAETAVKHEFTIVNVKATDVAGHDGNAFAKRDAIERIDAAMASITDIADDVVVAITGDHATPCSMKDHSGDALPILFNTSGISHDGSRFFDEISAAKGMWRITSIDVMYILKQMSDRSEKYGA